jgi:segregation and condensation protein B
VLAAVRVRVQLSRSGDTWAVRTAPDLGFLMGRSVTETRKLSRAAIETLAIVAYHQPCTRAEIEEIRGVSQSPGTLDQPVEFGWVKFGRPRMTSAGHPVTWVPEPWSASDPQNR